MKRRNLFLGLLLAISCAIVGVGYATLTRELKIGGQLAGQKDDTNLMVKFVESEFFSIVTPETDSAIVATPTRTNDHAANIDVSGMTEIGDKAEVYFLVQNASVATDNLDATLATPNVIVNNGSQTADDNDDDANVFKGEHFQITVEYVTTDDNLVAKSKAAGTGTVTGTTASLKAPITDPATEGQTIWVKTTIELIDVIIVDAFPTHNITVSFTASTAAA